MPQRPAGAPAAGQPGLLAAWTMHMELHARTSPPPCTSRHAALQAKPPQECSVGVWDHTYLPGLFPRTARSLQSGDDPLVVVAGLGVSHD